MCTSILFSNPGLFGRNMDIEYSFGEQVVITPRNYNFTFKKMSPLKTHYAIIGMATVADGYPLYAEAANEYGLYMAGLNFPKNAYYQKSADTPSAVAPYELIPLILGSCKNLSEVKGLLNGIQIADMPFNKNYPTAPLHWHIADISGAIVVESIKNGLEIHDDPVGVLTNNPPFLYHIMNLNNYQSLSPYRPQNNFCDSLELETYAQGMGALGLPGDSSSMSRYVKAAFLKLNTKLGDDTEDNVTQFFHILDSVAMVRGSVVTEQGKYDITTYSCCIDAEHGVYYYKTYGNNRITAINLFNERLDSSNLIIYPLTSKQDFLYLN